MAAAIQLSQQHSCSFDHLVGAAEQRGRQVEPERLARLEIDYQLEFDRKLHRKLAWLLALEDAIIGGFYRINERTPDMVRRSKPGSDFVVRGHSTILMKAQVWRCPSSRESITLAHSPPHRRPRLVPV